MGSGSAQNYFELFGLPVDFNLDASVLTERYRELQKVVHPDRFASASDREKRIAVQQAALINEALHTLKTPLRRARYILQLRGIEFNDEKETSHDPEFLMEQIEFREALQDLRQHEDPFSTLAHLMQEIQQKQDIMIDQIVDLLDSNDLNAAKSQVQKLQFLEKLRIECENLEQDLADSI